MQKFTFALFCVFAVSALAINDRKFALVTDQMRCQLCKDVVQNDAKWSRLDNFKEGALLDEAFKLCESVFHQGFEQLERLVCDDFATHSAPIVREHKAQALYGKHDAESVCQTVGFCN